MCLFAFAILSGCEQLSGGERYYHPIDGKEKVYKIENYNGHNVCIYYTTAIIKEDTRKASFLGGEGATDEYGILDTCEKFKIGDNIGINFYNVNDRNPADPNSKVDLVPVSTPDSTPKPKPTPWRNRPAKGPSNSPKSSPKIGDKNAKGQVWSGKRWL